MIDGIEREIMGLIRWWKNEIFGDKWRSAMWLMVAVFFVYFLYLAVLDHQGLRTQLWDLGHMEQALWSLVEGDWLMTVTHPVIPAQSRLLYHTNFIFYLLAPLYALFRSPYVFFIIGTGAVALGGVVVYHLAWRLTRNGFISWLWSFLLLYNPMIHDAVLYDFHPIILTVLLVPLLLYLIETKHLVLYWVVLLLLLSVKEDVPFLVLMLAPYVFVRHSKRVGVFTAIVTIVYWVLIRWVLPELLDVPLMGSFAWDRFRALGSSPEEMILFLLKNPQYIFSQLNHVKISYLAYLFIQGGFLAAFSPLIALAAVPAILINLLTYSNWQTQPIGTYYAVSIATTLLCSALYGYTVVRNFNKKLSNYFFGLLIGMILVLGTIFSPAPHGLISKWADFARGDSYRDLMEIKKMIPDDASMAAQNNIGAHFAARKEIYSLEQYRKKYPDYVLIHINSPVRRQWSIFFDKRLKTYVRAFVDYERQVNRLVKGKEYLFVHQEGDFYLFRHWSGGEGGWMSDEQKEEVAIKLRDLREESVSELDWSRRLELFFARVIYNKVPKQKNNFFRDGI